MAIQVFGVSWEQPLLYEANTLGRIDCLMLLFNYCLQQQAVQIVVVGNSR